MKDTLIVAKFTAIEMMKKKAFKITMAILLIGIIIGFNIPNIVNLFKKDSPDIGGIDSGEVILVMDEDDIYKGSLESLNQMHLGYLFEITSEVKTNEELKNLLEEKKIEAAIKVSLKESEVKLDYYTESIGLTGYTLVDSSIFSDLYKNVKLSEYGLTEEEIIEVNTPLSFEVIELHDGKSGAILTIAMFLCMILFFAIYYCAYQVASSITVEKTSKLMDTLITSVSPKSIVVGKTLGIGFVGLVQVLAVIITAFVSYQMFFPKELIVGTIDLSSVTLGFALVSIIYFILGYTFYAFIYALTGSLVSKPEDVQQAGGLISIVVLIGFYLAYFSMLNPASGFNNVASLIPLSSAFSVPARYMTGAVGYGELLLSISILIVSIVIVAYISIKIYSNAILNYGTKFNIKTMIEMFKR